MKKIRKDNKGFSLVELIVVVLIMAIIAIALAPQIMKWVNNSRISTDVSTMDNIVSSSETALTDETVWADCKGVSFTVKMNKAGGVTADSAPDSFKAKLKGILGKELADIKAKTADDYTFDINKGVIANKSWEDADKKMNS